MELDYLEFEWPVVELDKKIAELQSITSNKDIDIEKVLEGLHDERKSLMRRIFSNLTSWQVTQMSRHPKRPYTLDYIQHLFTDFIELHGDRTYADDHAVVGGLARLADRPVMVIGHQKGRDTQENIRRNFGMPRPEGYRKTLRLMVLAEKFSIPVLTFIDTPGAYPGIGAEERGQSEAIARNLQAMSILKTPILCTVIGEGGSGGALAIGVGDHLSMLSFSTYSVISPEGCASILWKDAKKAEVAAQAMSITADHLTKLGLVDEVLEEPIGGAHRDLRQMAVDMKSMLIRVLDELEVMTTEDLLKRRYSRLMRLGHFKE